MKKKLGLIFISLLFIASCKMGLHNNVAQNKEAKNYQPQVSLERPMLSKLEIPEENFENAENIREGYSIVKTLKDFDPSIILTCGGFVKGKLDFNDGYKYWLVYSNNEKALRYMLNHTPGVAYAEPDYKVEAPKYTVGKDASENEQDVNPISAMTIDETGKLEKDPAGDNYEYALRITKARNYFENGVEKKGAYEQCKYGANEVVIAIIDTGINMNHNDFKDTTGKSIVLYAKSAFKHEDVGNGPDFSPVPEGSFRELTVPSNEDGGAHGTHCSGTMCAVGDNDEGMCGVAWKNTKLISYKGLGNNGSGGLWGIYGALGDLAKIVTVLKKDPAERMPEEIAIIPTTVPPNYQITQTTVPVNMSLGGGGTNQFAVEMVNKAIAASVLPVIAMGNEGRTISAFPGALQGVLAVGATTARDTKASFSNSGSWISVCAPGHNIVSCANGDWSDFPATNDTTGITFMSGTSMATPFVTGMLGYLLSFDGARNLTPYQLKTILEKTADKIITENSYFDYDGNGFSKYYGYGRVNVLKAAQCVKGIGTEPIPAVGSVYAENPMTFTVQNTAFGQTLGLADKPIYLYEKDTNVCASIGITDSEGKVDFYGLKVGKSYIAKINEYNTPMEYEFVASKDGGNYTFAYTKNLVFVSTMSNFAYGDVSKEPFAAIGFSKPWLFLQVLATDKTLVVAGQQFYHKLSFEAEKNTEYYVAVSTWYYGGAYLGGNYGLYIGIQPKQWVNLIDKVNGADREQLANDSYEPNNTFDEADAKFTANQTAIPKGYWEVDIPANLVPGAGQNGENEFSGNGDADVYKFITPNN